MTTSFAMTVDAQREADSMPAALEMPNLLALLAEQYRSHAHTSEFYRFMDGLMRRAFEMTQGPFAPAKPIILGEMGSLLLPYVKFGAAIDSNDLFGLDELILFSYYYRNRNQYRRALDIGANIGLHSIVLAKCGLSVKAFEPDPGHFQILTRNVQLNSIMALCHAHQAAISNRQGTMEFVRVLGNTTSSHLAGSKPNPYGEIERFTVEVCDIRDVIQEVDLVKIDAEGHEDVIISTIPAEIWQSLDAFAEIGTAKTAAYLYEFFLRSSVNIFSQKIGWQKVEHVDDMPTSYREGSVFISQKPEMNW